MAERKVLIKYFPKNFDHERIVKRGRGKDKLMMVRNMLPMSLRCNTCQNYLYIGTKFNMRMEICNEETYLGIKVFRFYFKCTYCYAEITFKTDPKNHDYVVETGGTRNYEAIKDAQQAEKYLKRLKVNEKEENSMKYLENRSYDSKREMDLMEALEDIKNLNKRQALIDPEDLLQNLIYEEQEEDNFDEEEEAQVAKKYQELRQKLINGEEDGIFMQASSRPKPNQSSSCLQEEKDAMERLKRRDQFPVPGVPEKRFFANGSSQKVKVKSALSGMKKKITKPKCEVQLGPSSV